MILGIKRDAREDVGVTALVAVRSGTDDLAGAAPAAADAGATGSIADADRIVVACEIFERNECERVNRLVRRVAGAVEGTVFDGVLSAWLASLDGLLIIIDHRRRRLLSVLLVLRPIEAGSSEMLGIEGSSEAGLLVSEFEGVMIMGSWARRVPIGGKSGMRLSSRAWARLMWPSISSSSSSPSKNGVSGLATSFPSRAGGVCVSACRNVMRVGAGDGSEGGIV